jgi:predicted acetyltransferase
MQLYCHDLSVFFGLEVGADGRFGYPNLPLYWTEPDRRFPFFITADARLSGFALVMRGSPASSDPDVLDVAEFFVLRTQRRSGVGARAARLLWDLYPGAWTVRAATGNETAVHFWRQTIGAYCGVRPATERTLVMGGVSRQVFAFDTAPT